MHLKHTHIALVFAIGCASFLRAQEPIAKTDVKTYEIKGSYGTLIYEGKVERRETEKEFEYLIVNIELIFDPAKSVNVNVTKEIAAKEILIVATKKPSEGKGRSTILQRDKKPTSIVLTEGSPTATLEKIKLVLTKESVGKADHVGLGLTDGKLLWPITWDEQTVAPKLPQKTTLPMKILAPAKLELVSLPRTDLKLTMFSNERGTASRDYKPTNPSLVPLINNEQVAYSIVDRGLKSGAIPYTDRKFTITELPEKLSGLTLLQTRMSDKGIADSRFSVVLRATKPCYLFVAFREETTLIHEKYGLPSWLEEFDATDFAIDTDNPLRGKYRVFVKHCPSGRIALGACASEPQMSSMYFAFAAEAE